MNIAHLNRLLKQFFTGLGVLARGLPVYPRGCWVVNSFTVPCLPWFRAVQDQLHCIWQGVST